MDNLPLLAWILIGIAAVMVIGLNVSLLIAWRRRNEKPSPARGKESFWMKAWDNEDRQISELASRVQQLKQTNRPTSEDQPDDSHTPTGG